jgi:ATP-dependent Lon protease
MEDIINTSDEEEENSLESVLHVMLGDLLTDPSSINLTIKEKKEKNDPYLNKIGKRKRKKIEELEERLKKKSKQDKPLKYKILESNLNESTKSQILEKINDYNKLNPSSSEFQKMTKYIQGLEKIPFGIYSELPINKFSDKKKINNFFKKINQNLSKCVFGQQKAKNTLLEIVAKWVTNPSSVGNVIGLSGPPGIGKTSLIKNGLATSLNLPFSFISLGGSTCSSFLQGHDFTYEGSKWGRFVEILMETKSMNPIIFFDELDKISETKAGDEIVGILTHLTDPTQNNTFSDKYFSGIDFDFSKCLFIFSFNDENKINPILKDRIKIINLEGFKTDEKVEIARRFSIKKICRNIGFNESDVIIPKETLRFIAFTYCTEKGVRKLEKCIETIIMKLNLYSITNDLQYLNIKENEIINRPYNVSVRMAARFLDPIFKREEISMSCQMMYS